MKFMKSEEWRRKLVAMRNRGIPLKKCKEKLSKEYGIKEETVRQVWSRRDEWMLEVFDLDYEDTNKLINDLMAEKKTIKEVLWEVIEDGTSNAKIGAIKQLNKIDNDLIDMLQSLGIIHKEPEKVNLKEEIADELKNNPEKKEKIKQIYKLQKEIKEK